MPTNINLNPKTLENVVQGRAVLAFKINPGTPEEDEVVAGIVTVANIEGTDEPTDIWSPNGSTRTKVGQLPGPRSFKFGYTTISLTPDVRVLSVMGLKREGGIPAVANWSKTISAPTVGRRVDFGRPITSVAMQGFTKGEHFDVIENDEVALFKALPAPLPAEFKFTGQAAALPDAIVADMGRAPVRQVCMILRSFELDKKPYRIDMPLGLQRLTSLPLIGEDDAVEAEVEVELLADQTGSFGKITIY